MDADRDRRMNRDGRRTDTGNVNGPLWTLDIHSVKSQYLRHALVKSGGNMSLSYLWNDESGQDIAEYAVMLAVILVLVVGTVRLIGSNANNAFSNVASSLQ